MLANIKRVCCGNLHCNVLAVLCKAFFVCYIGVEFNHYADFAAAVYINGNCAFVTFEATNFKVLADNKNSVLKKFLNGLVANFNGEKFLNGSRVVVDNCLCSNFCKLLEAFVLCNEVGFGVYFDNGADVLFGVVDCHNNAFSSDSGGFFCSGGKSFFTKEFDSFFHIAVGFDKCFFAVKHAAFRCFTESFYVLCSKCHNYSASSSVSSSGEFCSPCLPSIIASAMVPAISFTARIASSLPGMT